METLHQTSGELNTIQIENTVLLAGNSNIQLAQGVAYNLNQFLGLPAGQFSDQETRVKIKENIRGRDIYFIQSTSSPANHNLMELLIMADAARRAGANKLTAVMPYFGYARMDRKDESKVPITAAMTANMLVNGGFDAIMTVDLHSSQVQGSVPIPWDDLPGRVALLPHVKAWNLPNPVFVSPDAGGVKRIEGILPYYPAPVVSMYKSRDNDGSDSSVIMGIMGEIPTNADLILWDDMIASGGSMMNAVELLLQHQPNSIQVVATHGVYNNGGLQRLNHHEIDHILTTNSIQQSRVMRWLQKGDKFLVADIAPMLAKAIYTNVTGGSLQQEFYPASL